MTFTRRCVHSHASDHLGLLGLFYVMVEQLVTAGTGVTLVRKKRHIASIKIRQIIILKNNVTQMIESFFAFLQHIKK
jgi:hypothetical protein